ncbi:MAG: DUF493 family protein, partial [Thiomargarita sp.]|nr:DUF493 family protein [Thiomargarita sp.]
MDKTPEKDDIFEFPCQFPIKVMGKSVDHFKSLIVDIVRHHTTEIEKVSMRTSSGGKYSAVTVSI